MVHECTNACLRDDIVNGDMSPASVERTARRHGHSTPEMAGKLAAAVGAQHLVLTHFSPRYSGAPHGKPARIMDEICSLAESEYHHGPVTAATDLMKLTVQIGGRVDVQPVSLVARADGGGGDDRGGPREW